MTPDCESSRQSPDPALASMAGNGLGSQGRIHEAQISEDGAVSTFDRLLEHARIEQLGEADRRKDEFLATVCHELRSPIGAIRNAIKVLRCQNDTRVAVHRMHQLIERQAQQMAFLVGGLLDITRIVRGKLTLQRHRVDLRNVVNSAVETGRGCGGRNVVFHVAGICLT